MPSDNYWSFNCLKIACDNLPWAVKVIHCEMVAEGERESQAWNIASRIKFIFSIAFAIIFIIAFDILTYGGESQESHTDRIASA